MRAEAHHHVPVAREPAALDVPEPEGAQVREQIVRVAQRTIERQCELCGIGAAAPDEALQRGKHFAGPATKFRTPLCQMSVDTSTSCGVMRMLFTEEGRPPRDRFETVPAVEMIVPFLVCSM